MHQDIHAFEILLSKDQCKLYFDIKDEIMDRWELHPKFLDNEHWDWLADLLKDYRKESEK